MDYGLQVGKSRDANTTCAINVKCIYSFFIQEIFEHPHFWQEKVTNHPSMQEYSR